MAKVTWTADMADAVCNADCLPWDSVPQKVRRAVINALRRGAVIESISEKNGYVWLPLTNPAFDADSAYRVRFDTLPQAIRDDIRLDLIAKQLEDDARRAREAEEARRKAEEDRRIREAIEAAARRAEEDRRAREAAARRAREDAERKARDLEIRIQNARDTAARIQREACAAQEQLNAAIRDRDRVVQTIRIGLV